MVNFVKFMKSGNEFMPCKAESRTMSPHKVAKSMPQAGFGLCARLKPARTMR
jgi:hypothetical protein